LYLFFFKSLNWLYLTPKGLPTLEALGVWVEFEFVVPFKEILTQYACIAMQEFAFCFLRQGLTM
jgi:hypothetical protein